MTMRYTAGIDMTGDDVVTAADNIQRIGDDMYAYLRGLVGGEQLSGEGIAQALEESQHRWNDACQEFARAEREFGMRTKDSYANMIAADHRGAAYF